MASAEELIQRAEEAAGEKINAAGVFNLQDNYKMIAGAGLASSFIPGSGSPLGAGLAGAGSIEGAREAEAVKEGVTPSMLVAVSDQFIHIFALHAFDSHPEKELMRFERSHTKVELKKFGLSRKIKLSDSQGQHLGLVGSTVKWTPSGEGDKSVLEELAEEN